MTLTIELDEETNRRLDELAARTGKSKVEHAAEILKFGVEEVEDYYDAVAVSERVRRGEERVYSSEEIRRSLGLDD